jgi:hypothetical protein
MVRPRRPLAVDDDAGSVGNQRAASANLLALAGPARQFAATADARPRDLGSRSIASHPMAAAVFIAVAARVRGLSRAKDPPFATPAK